MKHAPNNKRKRPHSERKMEVIGSDLLLIAIYIPFDDATSLFVIFQTFQNRHLICLINCFCFYSSLKKHNTTEPEGREMFIIFYLDYDTVNTHPPTKTTPHQT